jgi:nitroimidazol reductase NimA-like FMN-containing flavoprotein (pyridoxamine 5'-phosphate oxidase superfamily)
MNGEQRILTILRTCRFAVLATQGEGQPHTSLVAFTPIAGARTLVFATYRETLKYRNLSENRHVALFIWDRDGPTAGPGLRPLLTAHGVATEVTLSEREALAREHVKRHPDLERVLVLPDAALVRVEVTAYQIVGSIDDVHWYEVSEFSSSRSDPPTESS